MVSPHQQLALGALWVSALLFAWFARHMLLLAFGGILFAVFLHRLAAQVTRWARVPRGLAVAMVVVGLLCVIAAAFWLRGPQIAAQATELATQVPKAWQNLSQRIASYGWAQWVWARMPPVDQVLAGGDGAIARITGALSGLFGGVVGVLLIGFFALAIAATPSVYERGVLALVPRSRRSLASELLTAAGDTLWWWLLGRLLSMAFVGIATGIGLWLLGIPLAFVLGLIAALLSFVPNIGPIVSAVPAVLLAWVQQPVLALYVVGLYVAVQTVENYLLDPIIDRKTVYLPPALTVFAQLVFGIFAGLLGVAFAAPAVAVAMAVIQRSLAASRRSSESRTWELEATRSQ